MDGNESTLIVVETTESHLTTLHGPFTDMKQAALWAAQAGKKNVNYLKILRPN